MHTLNLQITDAADCSIIIVRDASVWDPNLVVQNAIVEVQPPLSTCFYPFSVTNSCSGVPGFGITLSCGQLGLCCEDCPPSASTLPDGNYNIRFSVDPNLATMVEFNYFRVCDLMNRYISAICDTRGQKNDLRPDQYNRRLTELRGIKELIEGAKWSAEECTDVHQALEMYNEAITQLQHYNHRSCL